MNMCPSLVEIRSVTSEIGRRKREERKKEEKITAVKYKPFGIAMPCGLKSAADTEKLHIAPHYTKNDRPNRR